MANQVLYGFLEHQDIFAEKLAGRNIDIAAEAIQQSVDEHNRQINNILDLFVTRTTDFQRRFLITTASRLQPLDDNGRARPIRVRGHYDVAFPIQSAGAAWGENYVARQKMTVGDANRITAAMLVADKRWVRDHVLAALLSGSSWTFEDEENGSLTIEPLADGGPERYQIIVGADDMATDNHILAQANAIDDGADDPFPTIESELMEHPENGGQVVALISSSLRSAVEDLTDFVPISDPNIRVGSGSDELVGTLGVALPDGDKSLFGYHRSGVWLAEWKGFPSGYLAALTTEGVRPLAMREDVEDVLQGFKQVAERSDHPFDESQWLRRAGFGAWNRVGALVMRIGNGSYAVPSGYTSPMP